MRQQSSNKLNNKTTLKLKYHIKNHLKDKEFKTLFLNFFEENYSQQTFPANDPLNISHSFESILLTIFTSYTIACISWEQYCLDMKSIRTQGWDLSTQRIARKVLSDLYIFTLESGNWDTKDINELLEHKEFLIWEERSSKSMSDYLFEKIGTNFPQSSKLEQLHFFSEGQLNMKKNVVSKPNILNLNISRGEIKELLVGFFLNEKRPGNALRHFVYLFRYSLEGMPKKPQTITDFTFEVFNTQYRFYEKANSNNVAITKSRSEKYSFTMYLARFYKYLCKIINEQNLQHNIFAGTKFNEQNIAYYSGKDKGKSVRYVKLQSEVTRSLKHHVKNHIDNGEFKSLFIKFIEDNYSQQVFPERERGTIIKYFEELLIKVFKNYTIELISWKQFCLSMKCIRVQKWEDKGKRMSRIMISNLYQYIIENLSFDTKDIAELREHKEFLIWEERKSSKMNAFLGDYLLDRIGTNFPLGSSLEQLYLLPGNDKKSPIILNLNTTNNEIKRLLLGFYHDEASSKQHNPIRQFIYLFKYSLLSVKSEPKSVYDFTFEVFKKQYRFYQKTDIINTSENRSFSVFLIRFYLYVSKISREENFQHNIFKGTLYNERILSSNTFSTYYESGYRLIAYNPFEDVPSANRWLLISPDGYANIRKNYHYGINFLEVEDKSLREDLKSYVWIQSTRSVSSVASGIYIVIEFLNFISNYKKSHDFEGLVNADLLDRWSFYIGSKEPSTVNNFVKRCRTYLKFYKNKYQIPNLLIDVLQQKPIDNDGGIPMTKHDIDLFSKKFQIQRNQGIMGEIFYIIFNLATTTKLRIGEILSLERNCILEKSNKTGVIQYYSKTSGNQKINATLTIEKVNLIEKAIQLTSEAHSKASKDIAKYIFIKEDGWRKDRIIEVAYQFSVNFTKIQSELKGQLDNIYRPYSLRTTFIDNIYTEGIKDGLPTQLIAEMAGNGEKTALRYYRETSKAQEYAEMFAGVTVSGVDVNGNILNEMEIEELNPVEEGLGGCTQIGCINDDEEYECLICPHFATTTNRIQLFKRQITTLKKQKEGTSNRLELSVIEAKLKLYTAYYLELLKEIGGDEDGTDI